MFSEGSFLHRTFVGSIEFENRLKEASSSDRPKCCYNLKVYLPKVQLSSKLSKLNIRSKRNIIINT